jgi:hypothetical protein
MAKKVTFSTAHDDKTTHLGKQKKTAAIEVPSSKEGIKSLLESLSKDTSKLPHGAQPKQIPSVSYILS